MPGLTDKLFDKLFDKEQNIDVTVNIELLNWLYDDSEEYQNLIKSQNDSVSRKENLKKLVFKLYREKKLKDVVFFKYLAWSGQGHLCKLIGYGDKQLKKWMEEKPKLANEAMDTGGSNAGIANKPHITSDTTNKAMEAYKDTGKGDNTLTTDSPRHPLHHSAEVKPPQHLPERTVPQKSSMEGAVVIDQIQDKSKMPTMRDLNRYITSKYAVDWYNIGIELGLETHVLKIIERDHPSQNATCFQKTLDKWLTSNKDDATWSTLEVAITNVNRAQLGLDPVDDVCGNKAWSGQGHLCKLIGFGDKQLEKQKEEKQKHTNEPMDTDRGDITVSSITQSKATHYFYNTSNEPVEADEDRGKGGDKVYADSPRLPLHHPAKVKPPPSENTSPQILSDAAGTHIIYSEKESDDVLELADFLNSCGIPCDIDQYHSHENILDWGLWNQQKIMKCAKDGGFVLLICSFRMCEQLSKSDECSRIQMKPGHIDSLSLNSLIKGEETVHCIIPVCLENLQMENIPKSLTERACYFLSISKLKQYEDPSYILSLPEFESLQRLVFRLKKQPDADRPLVAS